MNEPHYPFEASSNQFRYEFESVSEEKTVRKVVVFQETGLLNLYNLALLDILENGEESDMTISNNRDLEMVMATVLQIIATFLDKNPACSVHFKGNEERKTRLYRIVIGREISQLRQRFDVFGVTPQRSELFRSNTSYDAFVVSLKQD